LCHWNWVKRGKRTSGGKQSYRGQQRSCKEESGRSRENIKEGLICKSEYRWSLKAKEDNLVKKLDSAGKGTEGRRMKLPQNKSGGTKKKVGNKKSL